MKGQNVSLFCSNKNKSLQITYLLFRSGIFLQSQEGKGAPTVFNLSISEVRDLGPYKCKAQVSNCSGYSGEFNFTAVEPVTAPLLNITVIRTETGRHITLRCISFNGSLPINYTFFEKNVIISPAISKNERKPAEFNLTKKNAEEEKEYRCEAKNRLPNRALYSQPVTVTSAGRDGCPFCLQLLLPGLLVVLVIIILILAFWIPSKYKRRKAMRGHVSKDGGDIPMEAGIYENVSKNPADEESVPGLESGQGVSTAQDGTTQSQEIHYATPTFQEGTPGEQKVCNDSKTGYVYSELVFES
ncbi:PREDICTED: allergin-1 [Galeopterus variegatus]|uniref:Allergin-1 n=1 Tax=Galeopterus variegatus TaxID=482537 RepID=A0ABM0R3D4_GALVR|nr:PREDICTED: allergin-1 [Galeopterus variegatus]